jgi:type II secretory pathway component GspD/PulD (secretin)
MLSAMRKERGVRLISLCATLGALLAVQARAQQAPSHPAPLAQAAASPAKGLPATSVVKADAKKAKEAFKKGSRAEQDQDWQVAYEAYTDAVMWAPDNSDYLLRHEIAKGRLVQAKVDIAEREAVSGQMTEARRDLGAARELDPGNTTVRDRLAELIAAQVGSIRELPSEPELAGRVQLESQTGTQSFDYRGDTQGAYEAIASRFGVEAAFDVDLHSHTIRFRISDVDFFTAMRILGEMTGTFWRPLTKHLFFVTEDTPQKRKDYDVSVVRTVLLPASDTPEQMTEMLRLVREVTGITRSDLDTRTGTLTMRASPHALAVATDLIEDLQKPLGELVLEIEVLEVDRSYARDLGITPPQTATVYSLSQAEVQEAQQSLTGLVSVLSEVFGLPSSLTGLSTTQVTSLLATGQVGVGSLLPPLVAFGGGATTFLATMPGAAASFSEMLSLVRQGRRILLRAEDGRPASFFVGERIPVTLAQFSASLAGPGANVPGVASQNFPVTNYPTGNGPVFVTTGDLRDLGRQDMIVANHTDNTVSVFLSNGDGTFDAPLTDTTGTGPASIATGDFNGDTKLDLAVANQTANTVSILLGNGDGTFQPKRDIPTGAGPISVVTAAFNSTNNANLGFAVANHADNSISIFLGNGDGTFTPATPPAIATGAGPSSIAAADFNGDGIIDLAVTNQTANTVSIFLGNGNGTFQPRVDYATGNAPLYVATGDFVGNGVPDLAVANNTDDTVSILLGQTNANGTATGTFGVQTVFPAGNGPTSIAVADYNIDGRPDLAVTDQTDDAVSLLLGLGAGSFGPNLELPVGTNPLSIVTADFNGDGTPDAAVANNGSDTVSVILNSSTFTTANGLSGTPFPGVQYLDVGVKVKATPRMHQNDEVTLQLQLEVSTLTGQNFNTIPVIASQSVDQTVRLKENETTALAGMIEKQGMLGINGTPSLATLPGAGFLAGDQNGTQQDTDLLILITPRLVRLAPRKDHVIYAGRGALEGPGAAPSTRGEGAPIIQRNPIPSNVPQPPAPANIPPSEGAAPPSTPAPPSANRPTRATQPSTQEPAPPPNP